MKVYHLQSLRLVQHYRRQLKRLPDTSHKDQELNVIDWGDQKGWMSLVELNPGNTFVLRELGPTWLVTDKRDGFRILCVNIHNGIIQELLESTKVKQVK